VKEILAMKRIHLILAACATAVGALAALPGPQLQAQTNLNWEQVTTAYTAARNQGDSASIDKALALAGGFVGAHPQDGRAMTYQGSLAAMRARESLLPWKKLSMLHEGIGLMDDGVATVVKDKALAGGSTEIEVRIVRGTTSARIPGAFGRGGVARADFRSVIDNPNFEHLRPLDRASVLGWMAVLSHREGDAAASTKYLERARSADAQVANTLWETYQ
jgi:hypothetical protein